MSTYVCSDIHGDYSGLMSILEKINFSSKDQLIINGDLIDRGHWSAHLMEFVLDNENVELLLGNHELLFMNGFDIFPEIYIGKAYSCRARRFEETYLHYVNGGKATMDSLRRYYKYNIHDRDLSKEFYNYLKDAKLSKFINGIRISHTGVYDIENICKSVWDRSYWTFYDTGAKDVLGKSIIGHSSIGIRYSTIDVEGNNKYKFLLVNDDDNFVLNLDGSDLNIIPIYNIETNKIYLEKIRGDDLFLEVNAFSKICIERMRLETSKKDRRL